MAQAFKWQKIRPLAWDDAERERIAERNARLRAEKNAYRDQVHAIVDEHRAKPCEMCKQTFPPTVMEFHHKHPEDKLFNVGESFDLFPALDIVRAEIEKCVMLCRNCHAIETQRQRKAGVLKPRGERRYYQQR